jgi:hypothetical protein
MELYKPKLTYLSLKRSLESEKYRKRYEKSSTPSFITNRLRVSSLRHLRKASQADLNTNLKRVDSNQGSVVYHSTFSSQAADFNTCINSPQVLVEERSLRTEQSDRRVKIIQIKKQESQIDLLRKDMQELKMDVVRVQQFLHLQRLRKNVKQALVAEKENFGRSEKNLII